MAHRLEELTWGRPRHPGSGPHCFILALFPLPSSSAPAFPSLSQLLPSFLSPTLSVSPFHLPLSSFLFLWLNCQSVYNQAGLVIEIMPLPQSPECAPLCTALLFKQSAYLVSETEMLLSKAFSLHLSSLFILFHISFVPVSNQNSYTLQVTVAFRAGCVLGHGSV